MTEATIANPEAWAERQMQGDMVPVGCLDVETPSGMIHFHDSNCLLTSAIHREGIPSTVAVLSFDTASKTGRLTQLSPDAARQIAVSLIELANQLDPVAKH